MNHSPYKDIGSEFIKNYYGLLDIKNPDISKMYDDDAEAVFNDQELQTKSEIIQRLSELGERRIIREVISSDILTNNVQDIIVLVTGRIAPDNDLPIEYSEIFYLKYDNSRKSYFIHRQMFRLSRG